MTDEIIVKKLKKPATIINQDRPFFGPMSMWKELDNAFDAFRHQFDNHFWHPFRPFMVHPAMQASTRLPPIDFKETEDSFILTAEIPGIAKENIDISLTNARIDISADTAEEKHEEGECYVCQERSSTSFKRSFEFPQEIVSEGAEASMENGILKIILPKKEPEPKVEAKKLDRL
jgi:HSP20 family protein